MKTKLTLQVAIALATLIFAAAAQAAMVVPIVNLDFEQESDYTDNFRVINSTNSPVVGWNPGGFISMSGGNDFSKATILYDTTPGDGLTTIDRYLLDDGLRFDMRMTQQEYEYGAYIRINDAATEGYLVNVREGGNITLFVGNPSTSWGGSGIVADTISPTSDWLTMTIWANNNENDLLDITYELRRRDDGTLLSASGWYDVALSGSGLNPGQIAFFSNKRYSSTDIGFDNFIIFQIPEPASALLLALGGLFSLRRPRRRQK